MEDLLTTPENIKPGDRVVLKSSLVVDQVEHGLAGIDDIEFVAITFKHVEGQQIPFTVEIPTGPGSTVSTLERQT